MAVPKRRTSKMRRNRRRAHWKMKAPTLVECPNCISLKPPHRVCLSCGHYGDRQVLKMK